MVVPTLFFVLAYSYPLAVNFLPSYRIPADMVGHDEDVDVDEDGGGEERKERKGEEESDSEKSKV